MSVPASNDYNESLSQSYGSSKTQKLPRLPNLTDAQLEQLIDEIPKPPLTKCQAQLRRLAGNVSVEVEEEPFKYVVPEEEISSDDEAEKWRDEPFVTHPYPKHRARQGSTTKFSNERIQPMRRNRFGSTSTTQSRVTLLESEDTGESSTTSLTGSTWSEQAERSTSTVKGKQKQKYEGGISSDPPRNAPRGVVKCKSPLRRWFGKSHD